MNEQTQHIRRRGVAKFDRKNSRIYTLERTMPLCPGGECYRFQDGHCSLLMEYEGFSGKYCKNTNDTKAARMATIHEETGRWEPL